MASYFNTNIPTYGYCLESSHQATGALPSWGLLLEDACSLIHLLRWSNTTIPSFGYCVESSHQEPSPLPSSDLLSDDECCLCIVSAVARQSSTNIPSDGYCLESPHQATRAVPSWVLLLENAKIASFLIQLLRGSLIQPSRASDIASSRRIKLQQLFLLRPYFPNVVMQPLC
jgi:hypothetical protein